MQLPFFYKEDVNLATTQQVLDEDTSKHIVQVLRMQNGGQLQLTDGKGNLVTTEIIDNHKKKCMVKILSCAFQPAPARSIAIAISLIKNAHRFEWFLEKATEIGVSEIIPLICSRTEKINFRIERMQGILISAMLQSQQSWLPVLHEPTKFSTLIKRGGKAQKFIAHCEKGEPRVRLHTFPPPGGSIILIGPEGDFTIDEIELALQNNFVSVALGETRLRTETAGMVAATILALA